ncbi:MAG TPA: recombinase family protein, partial [Geobacteraceae bacterium]|nr:recombinase family protein [Geobacteraceae bacterium]
RRPEFQRMIAEACGDPPPFDAIIVHSLSRFFRDSFMFAYYERQLKKARVQVISITQQTGDDSAGEMARSIFSLFDEYQSKENAKHTLRAMKENARQGFFNGSVPPYGFRTVEAETQGNKGKKKRLEIDPEEAAMINMIYQLYLDGHQGKTLGMKGIAAHLNERGLTMRGRRWRKNIIHDMLKNRLYLGEYTFNRIEAKTRRVKPEAEWITCRVEPIISPDTFAQVQQKLVSRSPVKTPPRIVNAPTLLTGLIKCGCGASMTIATGKGGRYRYYKCSSRINDLAKGSGCTNSSVPMDKLDGLVLEAVANRVFTPERVAVMMKELQHNLKDSRKDYDEQLKKLTKELDAVKLQQDRLYEAVEKGLLHIDGTLQERVHRHQARRQEILTELAGLRRQKELPLAKLSMKHIQSFCTALREKLRDKGSNFGKEYLKLLVGKIVVNKKEVHLTGSYSSLAGALSMSAKPGLPMVPSFVPVWLTTTDSKQDLIPCHHQGSFVPVMPRIHSKSPPAGYLPGVPLCNMSHTG